MTAGSEEQKVEEQKVVVRDRRRIDPVTGAARQPGSAAPTVEPAEAAGKPAAEPADDAAQAAELAAARAEATERTADLKRITAEYANYRKRVDRDRAAVVDGATGAVLAGLLPVLDDIERARAHGDLTGAFKAVADQLEAGLEKLGLQPFGTVGDAFDPMLHEAVAHQGSAEVSVPTCMVVLRRGFKHGDRLLRPALVTVADPAEDAPAAAEPVAPTDLPAPAEQSRKPEQSEPAGKPSGKTPSGTDAVWTPPASAPGGSAGTPAESETDEDDESPVAWFGEPGEQQQD